MKLSPIEQSVKKHLASWLAASRWFVGFSGGMDSTVLLHILSKWKHLQPSLPELHAIYVHHGLQQAADSWPEHCQTICNQLNIPLTIVPVKVASEASVEQAARNARYDAYNRLLNHNDILLTAQHQRDQAETVLFRLCRGAGVKGIMGIPESRSLATGFVVRPLLDSNYNHLQQYAKKHQLVWVEDPTNQHVDIARNYIRHKVLPMLTQQWPAAIANIAQTASHAKEAQQLLDERAMDDLKSIGSSKLYDWLSLPSLCFSDMCQLSIARQKNVLSHWLAHYTLLPSTVHWQGWLDMLSAGQDTTPVWKLQMGSVYRSCNRIWWVPNEWQNKQLLKEPTYFTDPYCILTGNGHVNITTDLPLSSFYISYRQGGEVLNLAQRGRRDLKRLFNESNIPFFIRSRIPLLFDQSHKLVAIANFPQWIDQGYQKNIIFTWQPPAL